MTRLENDLDIARLAFLHHRANCQQCSRHQFAKTATLTLLCWDGTEMYRALLEVEHQYMLHEHRLERDRERKKERLAESMRW